MPRTFRLPRAVSSVLFIAFSSSLCAVSTVSGAREPEKKLSEQIVGSWCLVKQFPSEKTTTRAALKYLKKTLGAAAPKESDVVKFLPKAETVFRIGAKELRWGGAPSQAYSVEGKKLVIPRQEAGAKANPLAALANAFVPESATVTLKSDQLKLKTSKIEGFGKKAVTYTFERVHEADAKGFRRWKIDGETVHAMLSGRDGNKVELKNKYGKYKRVSLKDLSAADRAFLKMPKGSSEKVEEKKPKGAKGPGEKGVAR